MKKLFTLLLSIGGLSLFAGGNQFPKSPNASGFTENKGQVYDQHHQPRPDIIFTGNTGNLAFHMRQQGISYQLNKIDSWKEEKDPRMPQNQRIPIHTTIYRLDLEWPGSNPASQITTDAALPGYTNYYLAVCPDGVRNVSTYEGVVYKNLYDKIDLHYYRQNGQLKYDYLVAPQGDYKKIKIHIKGADKISLQPDGSVTLQTPLGDIIEGAPLVFQEGKQIAAAWALHGAELSFVIPDYDPALPLLIDPLVRNWGTYYGGSGNDEGRDCATDAGGNVYLVGRSNSGNAMATSGSFKTTLSGTSYDAYIAKFNTAGARLWATYYGGAGDDRAYSCATDASGNVYITGEAGYSSTSGISTAGAQQLNIGGGFNSDAFLAKFNSAGSRLWGTYYGGTGTDLGEGVAIDPLTQDVYMCGFSGASAALNVIATAGAHQTTFGAAFLAKFNPSGQRQWGTYYGNSAWSHAVGLAIDPSGNVIIAGNSDATAGIASPGALQATCLGMMDGYVAKFTSAGIRLWATFYGEISYDIFWSVCTDAAGNIYAAGSSGSPTGIATPGAHQTVIGMAYNPDGMLVKFDGNGVRQWATYYGGGTEDGIYSCLIAPSGDLFFSGYSNSVNPGVIATTNGFQPVNGGYGDGYLAQFTTGGVRVWGTFYGEASDDCGFSCTSDANNTIYLAGKAGTGNGSIFATPGCHQSAFGGSLISSEGDGFLAQFGSCLAPGAPLNITPANSATLCSGGSATLSATGTGTISWYNSAGAGSSLGTGASFMTPVLGVGTTTYYAEASNVCGTSASRTPITVTVLASPVTAVSGNTNICKGAVATLTAGGAAAYSWSTGAGAAVISVTPTSNTGYTVTGVSANGCSNKSSFTVSVFPCTGIEEAKEELRLNVFPNPVHEILSIQNSGPVEIKLINAIGQLLLQKKYDSEITRLDFVNYAPGFYFIEIRQENRLQVMKVVKE